MLLPLINAALFVGLTVAIGAIAMRALVLTRATLEAHHRTRFAHDAALAGAWGAFVVLVAAPARAIMQVADFAEPGEPWLPLLRVILESTSLGQALQLQGVAGAAALISFTVARQRSGSDAARTLGWTAAALAVFVLAFVPALTGHAAAASRPELAIPASLIHVLGAGVWIGGMIHLWRSGQDTSEASLTELLRAFHAVALAAAGAVVLSGTYKSITTLGAPADLITTPWGRLLAAKQALVLGVVVLGYRHWRTSEGAVARGARGALSTSMARELLVAAAVIGVTSFLAATSPPE